MRGLARKVATAILAAAVTFVLSACADGRETEAHRVCGGLIPVIDSQGATAEVVRRYETRPGVDGAFTVALDYVVGPNRHIVRRVACTFSRRGWRSEAEAARALIRVSTQLGDIGNLRLYLIKRYWLAGNGLGRSTASKAAR